MLKRNLSDKLARSFKSAPVVFLGGARQSGKSTLVRDLSSREIKAAYFTFDDARTLDMAARAPQEFIESLTLPAIIDEVQLAPGVSRAIKLVVDQERRPGMFLLTGSAGLMVQPTLAEALVGRMHTRNLYPFSQGELLGVKDDFPAFIFGADLRLTPADTDSHEKLAAGGLRNHLAAMVARGGFPVPALMDDEVERREWFGFYLTDIVRREIAHIADIERLRGIPTLLATLASAVGGIINVAELSSRLGIPNTTLHRYIEILSAAFVINFLKPWSTKLTTTLIKSPKLYLLDTGLACGLLNVDAHRLTFDDQLFGRLLENFVVSELSKQVSWSTLDCEIYHFRTRRGIEVDVVIKNSDGRLIPLEIKASKSVSADDFRGVDYFAAQFPEQYYRGIVLYCGRRTLGFGNKRWAMPVDTLWTGRQG